MFVWRFSYMDTEQYEEAVRDYEKVYQTEKTTGKRPFDMYSICYLVFNLLVWQSRAQAFVEDGTTGVKEEQEERLLQGARCCQECHWGWDQKGLSQTSSDAPPRYSLCAPFVSRMQDICFFFILILLLLLFFSLIFFILWHHRTDRHSSATPEVQKEEEKKFKEVGEAFTVLSDPKKKTRYDNGHDMDDDSFSGRGNLQFSFNHLWWDGVELLFFSRKEGWSTRL